MSKKKMGNIIGRYTAWSMKVVESKELNVVNLVPMTIHSHENNFET